jgi:hypothetical protein
MPQSARPSSNRAKRKNTRKRWLAPAFGGAALVVVAVLLAVMLPRWLSSGANPQEPAQDLLAAGPPLSEEQVAAQAAEVGPTRVVTADQTGYIKGLYMSWGAAGSDDHIQHVKALLETTELNALVMDFKGDRGYLSLSTTVPLAQEIGADDQVMMDDETWLEFHEWLRQRGVYTIARIVAMKDNVLAEAHPEYAVWDSVAGALWRDDEGLAWGDPSDTRVHDYNIALALEAAEKGFDEVQFDYVRFPSDGYVNRAVFGVENTLSSRVNSIVTFVKDAKAALEPHGVKLAADIFGYVGYMASDLGIGQYVEAMAPHLDVLCPMVYPSTYSMGLPGMAEEYFNAIAYPYTVVYESTRQAVIRATGMNPRLEVRPWLQDFKDYAFDGRHYTAGEIRLQIEGAREAGARGWLLWDPAVIYTPEALVSALPSHSPNTDGQVLVLAYQRVAEPDGDGQRSPAGFRADLQRLLDGGYYPVTLRDMVKGKLSAVPAGKRPVVLTFDGSTVDQFSILSDGNIDPDSAVGILRAFHAANVGDWPLRATFFVSLDETRPDRLLFGQADWEQYKLTLLADWGMEVGVQLASQANPQALTAEQLQRELGTAQSELAERLPGGSVVSLSVPYDVPAALEPLLSRGQHQGSAYRYSAMVRMAQGLAPSPRQQSFDATNIPRVPATQAELDRRLAALDQPGACYVSAGE